MFWMLRRSRLSSAAAFFNAINNNNNNTSNHPTVFLWMSVHSMRDCDFHCPTNYDPLCATNGYDHRTFANECEMDGYNHCPSSSRKGYNKLSGDEADNANSTVSHQQDSDTDSNLDTDLDFEEELTDDSDYDESLTCNVCDRSFSNPRTLAHHQQKKRHFGCSACDSLFPSLMALEHHKEEFEHWSGDEGESVEENIEESDDNSDDTVTSEELERLL